MKNLKKLSVKLSILIVSFLTVSMLNNNIFSAYVPAAGEESRQNISQMAQTLNKTQLRLANSRLIEAVSKGNLKDVEKQFKLKADPEAKDEKTNESVLALAQRKLQEAEAGSESEENRRGHTPSFLEDEKAHPGISLRLDGLFSRKHLQVI